MYRVGLDWAVMGNCVVEEIYFVIRSSVDKNISNISFYAINYLLYELTIQFNLFFNKII